MKRSKGTPAPTSEILQNQLVLDSLRQNSKRSLDPVAGCGADGDLESERETQPLSFVLMYYCKTQRLTLSWQHE
jgi:hypothetical protein